MNALSFAPKTLEELYYAFAVLALILGGVWGITQWIHSERLRHIREVPSFECRILSHITPLSDSKALISIDIEINNPGVVPIMPDTEQTILAITALDSLPDCGFVLEPVGDRKEDVTFPLKQKTGLIFEPHAITRLCSYYVATRDVPYLLRLEIPRLRCKHHDGKWVWRKQHLLYPISQENWPNQAMQPTASARHAGCSQPEEPTGAVVPPRSDGS